MAEARPRLVAVPPSSRGLQAGLNEVLQSDSVVTAYDDSKLRLAATLVENQADQEFLPYAEVVSRILRMQGQAAERLASRGQRQAITQLACKSLSGDSPLERSAHFPGMSRLVAANLDTLRRYGIGADQLRRTAERGSVSQQEKLTTLAEIAELVQDSMDAAKREFGTDRVARAMEKGLPNGPLRHLVVIAGPEESPALDQFFVWLASQGVAVDVIVELVPGRDDLFVPDQRTAVRIGAKNRSVVGQSAWYEALFTEEIAETCPNIEVFSAPDPLAEVEWIVRRCHALVTEGLAPRQIGIYLRDQDLYAPLLTSTAGFMGLPLASKRSVPLLSCGIATSIVALLRALVTQDLRAFARLAKISYFEADRKTQQTLWAKALELRTYSGERWKVFESWVLEEDLPTWVASTLRWRNEAGGGTLPLTVWLDKFRALVGDSSIFDLAVSADDSVRSRDLRAQTVLQRSLADFAFVYDQAGHRELSLFDFLQLAIETWEAETVVVEDGQAGVQLLFNAHGVEPLSALFVPGMLEGTIPRRRREDPLLNDNDLKLLSQTSGFSLPDSHQTVKTERDLFVRLCAAAEDSLVFSYPLTGEERENIPAYYLDELKRVANGQVIETAHNRSDWVPPLESCITEVDRVLRQAYEGPRDAPPVAELRENYAREVVSPDFQEGVSAAELAVSLTCPFQAAYRFRLQVYSPARRIGTRPLLDLPRTGRLAEAENPVVAKAQLQSALRDLLDRLSSNLEDWELELMRTTGDRLIEEWVEREFDARKVWPRNEGESSANVAFGTHGLKGEPVVQGRKIRLKQNLPAVSKIGGVSVVQLFEPRLPELDELHDRAATDNKAFELGLTLMAQHGRAERGMAVEIDSAAGERRLYVLARGIIEGLRSDAANDLTARVISGDPSAVFRSVVARLGDAVAGMERADAKAVPGAHCAECLYGELCRVSSEFGEEESPFGQDAR